MEALSRERESKRHPRHIVYNDITSMENLLAAWQEFLRGKRKRKDVIEFSLHLTDNIFLLHQELAEKTYRHGPYHAFKISDPKPREIHKAGVRDRLLHHAIHRILYPYFDRKFIFDSYSCRDDKGTHRAINRFREYSRIVSQNHTRTAWILKCDIRKFFTSINHETLIRILKKYIADKNIIWLLENIIGSFMLPPSEKEGRGGFNKINPPVSPFSKGGGCGAGLPLGNLTSQIFANVYMNEFDQWVKRELKAEYYIRYADDFVFLSQERDYLELIMPVIGDFLENRLKLFLHPDKVFIKTMASGVDFLGWINFPRHRVLRTSTKRRMFKRLSKSYSDGSIISYLGLLRHGDAYKLKRKIRIAD